MTFLKLDLFPFSGEVRKTPNLLGLSERANLNHLKTGPRSKHVSNKNGPFYLKVKTILRITQFAKKIAYHNFQCLLMHVLV
jgi:hypothetical protein